MTGRRLILADNTVLEDAEAGFATRWLWCYMYGYTMAEAAAMFCNNPEKTARIEYQYGNMSDEYIGYTRCTFLQLDEDGRVCVCLMQEVQNV